MAAFSYPNPLTPAEVDDLEARPALTNAPASVLELDVFLPGPQEPDIHAEVAAAAEAMVSEPDTRAFHVRVRMEGAKLGVHAFPPAAEVRDLSEEELLDEREYADLTTGFLPDHLPLRPRPERLDARLRVPRRFDALVSPEEGNQATTVFAPEDRRVFNDTSYPWSAQGRVDTALGWASGVMVGPRHMLTVSHTIVWNSDGSAGWVKFTPAYFDGSAPFGVAWGQQTYFRQKVVGPTIDGTEEQYDYVVVVLDRRIGDQTGWWGSRSYTDSWDGQALWSHVGYPGDLTSGNRPTYQSPFALDGRANQPDEHEAMLHRADVWPGQSGGPMFAWWTGETFPRVVSVQSWQNPNDNGASGGSNMVDLIIRARNENP